MPHGKVRSGRRKVPAWRSSVEGPFRFRYGSLEILVSLDADGVGRLRLVSPAGHVFEMKETARRIHFSRGTAMGLARDIICTMARAGSDPEAFRTSGRFPPDLTGRFLAAAPAFAPLAVQAARLVAVERRWAGIKPWLRSGPKEWSPRCGRFLENGAD